MSNRFKGLHNLSEEQIRAIPDDELWALLGMINNSIESAENFATPEIVKELTEAYQPFRDEFHRRMSVFRLRPN
jgi:hypothetical protein